MGRIRRSRTHKAQRDVHRAARTRARGRDLDQIQLLDLKPEARAQLEAQELNEEKPGLGQYYCVECARYCESPEALTSHQKGKVHKRRLKDLKFGAYTHEEAMRAAGKGGVDNKQRGVEPIVRRMEGVDEGEGKEEAVKGVEA